MLRRGSTRPHIKLRVLAGKPSFPFLWTGIAQQDYLFIDLLAANSVLARGFPVTRAEVFLKRLFKSSAAEEGTLGCNLASCYVVKRRRQIKSGAPKIWSHNQTLYKNKLANWLLAHTSKKGLFPSKLAPSRFSQVSFGGSLLKLARLCHGLPGGRSSLLEFTLC